MTTEKIHLDSKTKKAVLKLCDELLDKANGNNMVKSMAPDMAESAKGHGYLSPGQISWLANNARMRRIELRPELQEIVDEIERKETGNSDLGLHDDAIERKIFKCLRRIEKLLIKRLPA